MFEIAASTVLILLVSALGLLVLLLAMVIGISRRLKRVEHWLSSQPGPVESVPSHAETSAGGAFETFLSEDPVRRALTKAEQFAQYRKWRQEQGLNWTNS
jgi:hypothetical protein